MIINSVIAGAGGGGEESVFPTGWANYSVSPANGNYTASTSRICSMPLAGITKISLSDKVNYEMALFAYRMTNTSNNLSYVGQWNNSTQTFSTSNSYIFTTSDIDLSKYFVSASVNSNRILVRVELRNKVNTSATITEDEGSVCTIKVTNYGGS